MSILIKRLCDDPEWARTCESWDLAEWPRLNPALVEFFTLHYHDAAHQHSAAVPQTWVALDRGTPVGMMSLADTDHPDFIDKTPWLVSAFVVPEYRRRGIFKMLHDAVVDFAAMEMGLECLYAHSHLDFARLGWDVELETYDPFAPEKNVTIFKRNF